MSENIDLKAVAGQVRRDIVRMVHAVQSGHPGGSLGCTEFFVSLYGKVMQYQKGKFNMDGKDEDLFFLSNGHISPVWYSVLSRIANYFPASELATFRKLNSRLQGHPATHEGLPGIRVASGSLGQGLSVAAGAALAKKLNNDKHLVFTLHGDGELQEGQIWEAAMFAAGHKVDNLISTIDFNGQQIDGSTESVLPMGSIRDKFIAFGWEVLEMDGANMEEVIATLTKARGMTGKGKPIMIVMKTVMGNGVDFMMHSHKWHGIAPTDEQLSKALDQLPVTIGVY